MSLVDSCAGDWPDILGPTRSGIASSDEVLADTWPTEGPPVIWQRPVGRGYAGVVIADGMGFLFHRLGDQEILEAFDPASGKQIWADRYSTTFRPQVGGGDGPLCTPCISGKRIITFGAQGILTCHDTHSGMLLWQRNTHTDFDAREGYFGAGSSPIVVGDIVIVNVGGSKQDAGIVGFELSTGKTKWSTTTQPASYSSPTQVKIGKTSFTIIITRYKCLLVEPESGEIRWEFPFGMRGPTVNAAVPVIQKKSTGLSLLITAAYGIGTMEGTFDENTFTKRWESLDTLASQYCTPILIGPHAYCIDGRDDMPPTSMKCIDTHTGIVRWNQDNFGYGTLIYADEKIIAAKTNGELVLMEANPQHFNILGQHRALSGTLRALPALADGKLFLRDDATLVCLNVGR